MATLSKSSMETAYSEMEEKMREQIRVLQEQRAAAMMNEMIDLQKERDVALSRIKILKKSVENLTLENELLKRTIGQEKLAERFMLLEQNFIEEQLLTKDLRKKLHGVNKQNATQELKIRKLEVELAAYKKGSPKTPTAAMIRLNIENDLARERSHSMNDLSTEGTKDQEMNGKTDSNEPSRSPRSGSSSVKRLKQKRRSPPVLTIPSNASSPLLNGLSSPGSPTTNYSPSVIPRRYKLAAVISRDAGVQTDTSDHIEITVNGVDVFTKDELTKLRREKQDLEVQLSEETCKREKDVERHKRLRKDCQVVQTECSVLRDSLTEFTRWVRQKVQLIEEDMDIFRVVYSLHGSLSQESDTLSHLQKKLGEAEQNVLHLEATNRILTEMATQAEEKYKLAQKQIEMLKEKISLLSPTSSPHKKRMSTSPKLHHRVRPLVGMKAAASASNGVKHSSPLLRKATSPLVTGGKIAVTEYEEGWSKTRDVV